MGRLRLLLCSAMALAASGCSCGGDGPGGRPDAAGGGLIDGALPDAVGRDAPPPDAAPEDADVLARQSARLALVAAALIEQNTSCGFASPAVAGTATFTGAIGGPATMTQTISSGVPCVLFFAAPTTVATDCIGGSSVVVGQIAISGTRVVTGRRTGSVVDPMWIDRTDGVELELSISFTDFALGPSPAIEALSGSLDVRVAPEMARAAATTLCTVETPIATIEDLSWHDAALRLTTGGEEVEHTVSASAIDASRGPAVGGTNALSGTITVDGITGGVGGDGLGLDPIYVPATFDASWQCTGSLEQPVSRDCWPPPAVAAAAARGIVRDVVFAAGTLDADTSCGFSSDGAAAGAEYSPPFESGIPGSETRTATGCTIEVPPSTSVPDCVSSQTVGGTFTATGTRAIAGLYTDSASEPTVPTTRTGMTWSLSSLALTDVEAQTPGGGALSFRASGTVAAELAPIGGERTSQEGVYSIRTPVFRIPSVTATSLTGAIRSPGGARVDLAVSDVSLAAAIGLYENTGNSLSGTITIDGEVVTFSPGSSVLDPAYDQATFDSRYACTPDLRSVVPPGP